MSIWFFLRKVGSMLFFLEKLGIKAAMHCRLVNGNQEHLLWGLDWNSKRALLESKNRWFWLPLQNVEISNVTNIVDKLSEFYASHDEKILGVNWLEGTLLISKDTHLDWVTEEDLELP